MISQRVQQLKDGLFLNTGEISLERVRLYAKSRQRTVSDRSIIMRRAKAIANFLKYPSVLANFSPAALRLNHVQECSHRKRIPTGLQTN